MSSSTTPGLVPKKSNAVKGIIHTKAIPAHSNVQSLTYRIAVTIAENSNLLCADTTDPFSSTNSERRIDESAIGLSGLW
jgi:hypothetical protein